MSNLIKDFWTKENGKDVRYVRLSNPKIWYKEILGKRLEVVESYEVVFGTKYVTRKDVIEAFK